MTVKLLAASLLSIAMTNLACTDSVGDLLKAFKPYAISDQTQDIEATQGRGNQRTVVKLRMRKMELKGLSANKAYKILEDAVKRRKGWKITGRPSPDNLYGSDAGFGPQVPGGGYEQITIRFAGSKSPANASDSLELRQKANDVVVPLLLVDSIKLSERQVP